MQPTVQPSLQVFYKNQYSPSTEAWRKLGAKGKAQNIIRITQGFTWYKVLEVGAGDGSVLQALASQNFAQQYYALEISESGLAQIQAKNIPHLQEAQLFDGYHIPYPDHFFDLVILTHVLEHVEHERLLLREIKRVSKHQVIEVPRDYRYGVEKKINHFLSYGHINLYTPSLLKFLLLTENFQILREQWGVYEQKVFTFYAKNIWQKWKGNIVFWVKKTLSSIPYKPLQARFINTITVFCQS
ncbi:MAG: class I SAM-dependent methyltransferase [Microscillaceae bacterium]|nr:class I SAM-dependent methyltransferase [Microscillaceae bacterium]MDW8461238.1 class I SAM-dependent methyltransferase [Cytophagales bacterium]